MKGMIILVLLATSILAGIASAQPITLVMPTQVVDNMWVFEDLCPFTPTRAADPMYVDTLRFTMLDLDPYDNFWFTWVSLPQGFGWDGSFFDVFFDDVLVGQVTPSPWNVGQSQPQTVFTFASPVKVFEIRGIPLGVLDPNNPDDQAIFPFWVGWTPNTCGADIGVTLIPEPGTVGLLAVGSLVLLRRGWRRRRS